MLEPLVSLAGNVEAGDDSPSEANSTILARCQSRRAVFDAATRASSTTRSSSHTSTKQLRRGTHTSVKDLQDSINAWTENGNQDPRPFTWRKSADDIFETMAAYLQRIPNSGHSASSGG